ncbi:MAG TPA: GNAT family N-acetyltransferase [Rudaea sp.]
MIPNDFTVEIADWSNDADRAACREVREQVFIVEQNVPQEDEWDDLDARSRHALARDSNGHPIGTGRLTPNATIGRMAVMKDWRGRQVGAALVQILLEQARAIGYTSIELHSQTHAIPFYARFGFEPYGDEYVECAIPHRNMRLELAPFSARPPASVPPRPEPRVVEVESIDEALHETLALISAARREVAIYTRDLDPQLFDVAAILDALKKLATSGRGVSIRILIQQPQIPSRDGHRLIALAQRLPSIFALRTPCEETDLQYPSAFVLNDQRGFYFRVLGNRFEGEAINYAPGRHAQLQDYFDRVWERSTPSEELRQLSL